MKFVGLLALSATALAASVPSQNEGKFLVETAPGQTQWVTEDQKMELKMQGKDFIDITHEVEQNIRPSSFRTANVATNFPRTMTQEKAVKAMIAELSKENMQRDLTRLTQFHNRYYQSETGVQSATWIMQQAQAAVQAAGARGAKVEKFPHKFKQFSIVVTLPGKSEKTVVVGAHQDSINQRDRATGRAPGADDNGSGSMTILEALRGVLQNRDVVAGNAPNTMEFHWYAGEELGLLGSADIFARYMQQRKQIKAMLNQDMTGFVKRGVREEFGVITDNVNAELSQFARTVIGKYTRLPYVNTRCGYACSDHASANRYGFPSAMVAEAAFNNISPTIHSPADELSTINYDHMLEHAKLVVGFMTELAFQNNL
ncbi:Leucine aminopeptidase 1 [Ophidiomyces ophidiicola]|uniref:Leucine aminopeptidase 1 n=1 Tax=Ophidiomyces ophidiicola TaxID=1387563 RepID=A0ACB8UQ49_9EURO|nr:Leucine aminopeptidase 1 [Ophidiomyces ophidiicola]KAI1913406.1 Leucine aminopeptidase 1 [Ophidiomyces ophidiicola]KAI1919623.1 Leucine aminopeptidase 1 [Ophidiomyces ophidiicola]KAI1927129.1 Leucine aminopeptidase 1 [Ophidiomyces ophidiicola]KAI1933738.1 Leucine aminopeptidase 1 [Ophidiomyces ophidiicola]KAI1947301.1 Leucine aminopeptidase 1 [Ophidiomyces ophidiicola]